MKKILLDATPLVRKNFDGISRYSQKLVEAFEKQYSDEYQISRVGFFDDAGVLQQKIWLPRRIFSGLFKLLSLDLRSRAEIGVYSNFVIFPLRAKKSVVVVHDLAYVDRAHEVAPKNRAYLTRFVERSVRKANIVITLSEFMKDRIQAYYNVPASRIVVVPCGIDTAQFKQPSAANEEKVRQKYKLPGKYILCLGSVEPRKNLIGAIEAYALLDEGLRKAYALVLAGDSGWLNEEIHHKIEELRTAGNEIQLTGYIDDNDLPAIYSLSSTLLFPSHYEGFGLPILEAQAVGVPVITSNLGPMKDVADDGAVLCDPTDPASIAAALQKLLTTPSLAEELVKHGASNVTQYSWNNSAAKLKEILASL